MHWYLIHTKPRQEKVALENLERQGYVCYLPLLPAEKIRQGSVDIIEEPLFPRYLFIRLDQTGTAKSWNPIRSTKGVSRLVSFGNEPAKIDDGLVELLQKQEYTTRRAPRPLFHPGERVSLAAGAFTGLEGIYQLANGESRAMILIELLSKPVPLGVSRALLRKTS